MKHFFAVVLIAAMSMLAGGDTGAVGSLSAGDTQCDAVMKGSVLKEALGQKACCQANQGICGCRAGKIVCCDKSFSAGCTC